MGKNWQFRHKVKTRSLLVIDNGPIRSLRAKSVEKTLKQTLAIQQKKENFEKQDLKLYEAWYRLEFGKILSELSDSQAEHQILGRRHNFLIAISQMENVSMFEAARIYLEEERVLASSDAAAKVRIEELRKLREDYIEEEMARVFGGRDNGEGDEFSDDLDDVYDDHYDANDDANDHESAGEKGDKKEKGTSGYKSKSRSNSSKNKEDYGVKELLEELKDMFRDIWDLPPSRVPWRDVDLGSHYLGMHVERSRLTGEWRIFDESFKRAPPNVIKEFKRKFMAVYGVPFEVLIHELQSESRENKEEGLDNEQEDFDPENMNFVRSKGRISKALSMKEETELKALFRRVARMLHPDHQSELIRNMGWMDLWSQAQDAHGKRDLERLRNLDLYLAYLVGDHSRLGMSDFDLLDKYLIDRKSNLEDSIEGLKGHPAWGFSNKKSYTALIKKVGGPLKRQLSEIKERIEDLTEQFQFLERIAKKVVDPFKKQNRKAKQGQKQKRSQRSSQRKYGRGRRVAKSYREPEQAAFHGFD